MKTTPTFLLLASLATSLSLVAAEPPTNAPGADPQKPAPATPDVVAAASTNATNTAAPAAATTNAASTDAAVAIAPSMAATNFPTDGLRMNFRGVPLEMVLNYLSEAAGFIIVLETRVRGTVDAWSNQPLTKDEAVSLLNTVLNKNGYGAIRNDRTLTIVEKDALKTRDIPVKRESDPDKIPKTDEMVTQIIPIKFINAAQLIKDLQPLLPVTGSSLTANENGNALILTDTQINIHRMAEIVKALDTSVANSSTIRVYPLKFADAKTVATVIKDLFQSQDSGGRNANDMRTQFFQRMRGGGGDGGGFPGMGGGGGGDRGGGGGGGGRMPTPKVVATSDDRSNALVVSAPDDMIATIDDLIKAVDIDVDDLTELKVFRLQYADPLEMANMLAGLFPDDTRNDANSSRGGTRFAGGNFGGGLFGGGGRGGRGSAATANQSDRMKKMGRVLAVPDPRTSSVIVSAARELMPQIGAMIEQLDSDPRRKQKVFVYSLENADPQEVEQLLRNMFDRNGTMNNRNTQNQNSRLNTRQNQNQSTTGSSIGSGGRGIGGGGLGGGGGGGGF